MDPDFKDLLPWQEMSRRVKDLEERLRQHLEDHPTSMCAGCDAHLRDLQARAELDLEELIKVFELLTTMSRLCQQLEKRIEALEETQAIIKAYFAEGPSMQIHDLRVQIVSLWKVINDLQSYHK